MHPSHVLPSSHGPGLRELEAAFTGKRVDLHVDNDHSASFKHMGRPTCGRCFSLLVVRFIWHPPCSGFGMEYDRGTETSIYLVLAGST